MILHRIREDHFALRRVPEPNGARVRSGQDSATIIQVLDTNETPGFSDEFTRGGVRAIVLFEVPAKTTERQFCPVWRKRNTWTFGELLNQIKVVDTPYACVTPVCGCGQQLSVW